MASALTETAAQRQHIYRRLGQRNRTIGLFRLLVPGLGIAVFVVLSGQVLIANLGEGFSIGRVSLQSDRMVVETPSYSGVTGDGSVYRVTALSAEAGLDAMDAVTLNGATLVIEGIDGIDTTAKASRAAVQMAGQEVAIEGKTAISSSSGMTGTVIGLDVDFAQQRATSDGAVSFAFAGGEQLDAANMLYDGAAQRWTFAGVTLTLPDAPKAMAR